MKKLVYILIAFVVAACSSDKAGNNEGYQFSGTMKGAENKQIFLEKLAPSGVTKIDTAMVDASGNFSFSGSIDAISFGRVYLSPRQAWLIVLDNESYVGEFDASSREFSMTNSPETNQLIDLMDFQMSFLSSNQKLKMDIQQAKIQGDEATFDKLNGQFFAALNKNKQDMKAYMDSSESFVRMFCYNFMDLNQDAEFVMSQLEKDKAKWGNHYYIADIEAKLKKFEQKKAAQTSISKGNVAPEITYTDPNGKTRSLSDLRGKVVLLDFWASWCGPCRRENPHVVELYNTYKSKGFEIFSVSLDNNRTKWINAIAQDGLGWSNHVSDLKGWESDLAAIYNVNSIPATFVLDKNGVIVATNKRGNELTKVVKSLLDV